MLAEDLRTKSEDELNKELLDLRKKQFNLRFQKSNGQLENTAQLRLVRRDIARVKTVITQKVKGIEVTPQQPVQKTKKKTTKTAQNKTAAKPAKTVKNSGGTKKASAKTTAKSGTQKKTAAAKSAKSSAKSKTTKADENKTKTKTKTVSKD